LTGAFGAGLIGFAIGIGLTAAAAWYLGRRHARRVRAAERRARAAERLAEIGALTAGLTHEIKNPLSTIGLNTQLLSEAVGELDIPEEDAAGLRRRAGTLSREVERLQGILADFLEYAGELRLDRREADLNAIVDEFVDFFAPQAEQQGVRLRADPSSTPVRAHIDAPLVKQCLLNLALNAVQVIERSRATQGPGGEIIIRTTRGQDAHGPTACIHVIDTGPGMDQETRSKIFQPYFSTRSGGSGLGLPVTRRIVEQHGGHIDLHSEPGKGTDFTLVFPVQPPADGG